MPVKDHSGPGKVLSLEDLVDELGCSKRSLYRMVQAGKLPGAFKFGNRWRIPSEALEALRAQQAAQPSQPRTAAGTDQPRDPRPPLHDAEILIQTRDALTRAMDTVNVLQEPITRLVAPASENGITAIYSPRRSPSPTNANRAIQSFLESATGEVLLQGTTLRRFFHDGELRAVLARQLQARTVNVKALLLDPCSDDACARATIEEAPRKGKRAYIDDAGLFSETQLFVDIQRSVTTTRAFQDQQLEIDARFYSCTPFAFFILTETGLISEQYHVGRPADASHGICIGENMPLIHGSVTIESAQGEKQTSPYYEEMKSSFLNLWEMLDAGDHAPFRVRSLSDVYEEISYIRANRSWPSKALR